MSRLRPRSLLLALLCCVLSPAYAEIARDDLADIVDGDERYLAAKQLFGAPVIEIPRLQAQMDIDGRLAEAVWQQAARVQVAWQFNPVANIPATQKTTAYIFEDGEKLYVAFDARAKDASLIRAHLRQRDKLFNDDFVGFSLDTTGDASRAFSFFANPLGVQGDATVDPFRGEDFTFDAIFETGGQVNADGYVVEFAVPFSQLRFAKKAGSQSWKVSFTRTHWGDRRYQAISFPADRNTECFVCEFQTASGMPNLTPGRQIQVVPSLTARAERTERVAGPEDRDFDVEAGIDDFRWGITPDLSLNATINPDFSQIEADIAQSAVNTSFVLFFPERRPFFLEGRDLFSTPLNIVNTRNISDPEYGAKLSGKVGNNVYGLMTARDRVTNFLLGGFESSTTDQIDEENQSTVLRYRRDLGNGSHLGFLGTHRTGTDYDNHVVALDGKYRLPNNHTIEAQFARSDSDLPQALVDEHDIKAQSRANAFRLFYEFQNENWFWNIRHQHIDEDFGADLGFLNARDFAVTNGVLGWRRRGQEGETLHHLNFGTTFGNSERVSNSDLIWRGNGAFVNFGLPRDTWLTLSFFTQDRVFSGEKFDLTSYDLRLSTRPREGLSYRLAIRTGDQIDVVNVQPGDAVWVQQNLEYNFNEHWLLRLRHTYQELEVSGGTLFETHLTDLRLSYQFDLRSSLLLTLINRNTRRYEERYIDPPTNRSEGLDAQLLYTYQVNSRSVLYLGYASTSFGNDDVRGLEQDADSVFLKITYAYDR